MSEVRLVRSLLCRLIGHAEPVKVVLAIGRNRQITRCSRCHKTFHERELKACDGDGVPYTHWCDDCEMGLTILYDAREDDDTPIVCGHCGGTNTRPIEEVTC